MEKEKRSGNIIKGSKLFTATYHKEDDLRLESVEKLFSNTDGLNGWLMELMADG